jgi:hypothetical protein
MKNETPALSDAELDAVSGGKDSTLRNVALDVAHDVNPTVATRYGQGHHSKHPGLSKTRRGCAVGLDAASAANRP